jgi:hypothetical protein
MDKYRIASNRVIRQPDKSTDTDLLTTWFIQILQVFFMAYNLNDSGKNKKNQKIKVGVCLWMKTLRITLGLREIWTI